MSDVTQAVVTHVSGNQERQNDSETLNGAGWLTTVDLTEGELSSSSWFEFQGFMMIQAFSLLLYTNIHIGAITGDGSSTGDNTG